MMEFKTTPEADVDRIAQEIQNLYPSPHYIPMAADTGLLLALSPNAVEFGTRSCLMLAVDPENPSDPEGAAFMLFGWEGQDSIVYGSYGASREFIDLMRAEMDANNRALQGGER